MLVVLHIVNNRGKAEDGHCYEEENINVERGKLIQKGQGIIQKDTGYDGHQGPKLDS